MSKVTYNSFLVILIFTELIVSITAILGGYKLITTNGMGMPVSFLANSPFRSFIIPGLVLFLVVGGTNLIAAVSQLKKHRFSSYMSAIGGFGLQIWIFTEMYLLGHASWLQALYFSLAILILVITMIFLNYEKSEN